LSTPIRIGLRRLDTDLPIPRAAHPGDAGLDVYAREDVLLAPGERYLMPTGIAIALPVGFADFTHPRSGLAARHGITIVNAPGTVDAGYRGEIRICLLNTDTSESVGLHRGDLIAQLVVQPVARARFVTRDHLTPTERGTAGHGSTGGIHHWDVPSTVAPHDTQETTQ